MPDYKSKPDKPANLREVHIYGHESAEGYARTIAEAKGNNLARYLTAQPPNELTPGRYRRRIEQLARACGWKTEFLDVKKLKARGAGAFLAVAQGSPEPDAGILHLRYTPKKKSARKPLALVGKGICFDTGGTNLKPARHMHGMHEDMEGSAVALGALLALTELKADFPVDCWLALAQNHIGPKAYKQNDVVKAANGTTIEIVHTDAEGRMVLADTLYFASQQKPKLLVDYATLTGACVGALSTRMSGTLTNRDKLIPVLIEAGNSSGERVWPFPLPKDFEDALKSDIADVKQCTLDNDADHILAATFLKKFLVNDPDWVHVDLSAGNHKGGLAHIPTDVTGFGVRFTLNLLLDQKII
jgi:leucyl aminopeptidase